MYDYGPLYMINYGSPKTILLWVELTLWVTHICIYGYKICMVMAHNAIMPTKFISLLCVTVMVVM